MKFFSDYLDKYDDLLFKERLTNEEYDRILSKKNLFHCVESMVSRIMISNQLEKMGMQGFKLSCDSLGKPIVLGVKTHLQISISYSNLFVVVAISDEVVGIDVEYSGRKFPKNIIENWSLREQLMNPYRIWTSKESYLKFLGTGLRKSISSISIDCLPLCCNMVIDTGLKKSLCSQTITVSNYVITLTSVTNRFIIKPCHFLN
nr:4'-phosphopantetheinyl transferase superfamily protein [Streptococcus lutetiensis]